MWPLVSLSMSLSQCELQSHLMGLSWNFGLFQCELCFLSICFSWNLNLSQYGLHWTLVSQCDLWFLNNVSFGTLVSLNMDFGVSQCELWSLSRWLCWNFGLSMWTLMCLNVKHTMRTSVSLNMSLLEFGSFNVRFGLSIVSLLELLSLNMNLGLTQCEFWSPSTWLYWNLGLFQCELCSFSMCLCWTFDISQCITLETWVFECELQSLSSISFGTLVSLNANFGLF